MSWIVRTGKAIKKKLLGEKSRIPDRDFVSVVRRIDRLAVDGKYCAMTFDDGPCALPPEPGGADASSLTETLLETLRAYGATATFDVVGDTSENYPDIAGKAGQTDWGGIAYDHYPYLGKDVMGGAKNQPELVQKILDAGCEISNHAYRHVLFGRKNFVYGKRRIWQNAKDVLADAERLHGLLSSRFGVIVRLARPPHYVDRIGKYLTSYDVYERLGYQYMGASFDGAGWLPCASYEEEVAAMAEPIRRALEADPDSLIGQIIFGKDGYNMAFRSPVADGLPKQLKLLTEAGYRVMSVSELMKHGCFSDISPKHPSYANAEKLLAAGYPVAYRDNTLRPDALMTVGEWLYILTPAAYREERFRLLASGRNPRLYPHVLLSHPYGAAALYAKEQGLWREEKISWGAPLTAERLNEIRLTLHLTEKCYEGADPVTRAEGLRFLAELLPENIG